METEKNDGLEVTNTSVRYEDWDKRETDLMLKISNVDGGCGRRKKISRSGMCYYRIHRSKLMEFWYNFQWVEYRGIK